MKRALVIGGGGLYGAYDAGALTVLCKELGPMYFDAVYAVSSGGITAPFFLSSQIKTIEETWRTVAFGKLIRWGNIFFWRNVIDLDYLMSIFQYGRSKLDTEKVFSSPTKLIYALTDCQNGNAVYINSTPGTIFNLMRASGAVPVLYGPVDLGGKTFVDGGFSDMLPVEKALGDGYDDMLAIWSLPLGLKTQPLSRISKAFSFFLPRPTAKLLFCYEEQIAKKEDFLRNQKLIRVIRPQSNLPLRSFVDANAERVSATFDQGVKDAYRFLATL